MDKKDLIEKLTYIKGIFEIITEDDSDDECIEALEEAIKIIKD